MKITHPTRRDFLKSLGIITATCTTGAGAITLNSCNKKPVINKRDAMFSLLTSNKKQDYIPAGFFVHFGDGYRWGDAAVNRHLEYFKAIDMDFIKVQYEASFPPISSIKRPEDWTKMPLYKKDFYEDQLYVVRELVKKSKNLAPVIVTLYSPFMCGGHSITSQLLTEHMKEDPDKVKKGMEIITESVMIFAQECIKLGADGFLASTQGGESFRFEDPAIFQDYIKPYDLVIMDEINSKCSCNILHICDYEGGYSDLSPFLDYPGQIVNCSLELGDGTLSTKELFNKFNRPFMGGFDKTGSVANGSADQVQEDVNNVLMEAPEKFILGAECALQGEIDWNSIRSAVDTAHSFYG